MADGLTTAQVRSNETNYVHAILSKALLARDALRFCKPSKQSGKNPVALDTASKFSHFLLCRSSEQEVGLLTAP